MNVNVYSVQQQAVKISSLYVFPAQHLWSQSKLRCSLQLLIAPSLHFTLRNMDNQIQ